MLQVATTPARGPEKLKTSTFCAFSVTCFYVLKIACKSGS